VITEADLVALNQRALMRVLDIARRLSLILFGIAGVLLVMWFWIVLRQQGVIATTEQEFSPMFAYGEDLSVRGRIDFLAASASDLALAAIVFGLALGLRVYCDASTLSAGGPLTGWELGDRIDTDPVDLDG
jgi:hypothetical protein